MRLDTLKGAFRAMFDRALLETAAEAVGAFARSRKVQPQDLLLALLSGCCTGPSRSIAGSRRAWERLAGETISRSAFDAQLDDASRVRWLWHLLAVALAIHNRRARRAWPGPMHALADVLIEDGTQTKVRAKLCTMRSTTPGQSAVKLIGTLSLGAGQALDLRTAAAVHHDRPLMRGAPVAGALYLRDLGFYDHTLFAALVLAGAFFVSRLKYCAKPTIARVVLGIAGGEQLVGEVLHGGLDYGTAVDLDAHFRVRGEHEPRVLRVVKVDVPKTDRHGKPSSGVMECWFVTNLPREQWPAETLAALYRLRWALERLWRSSKHLARMDQLDTGRLTIVYVFIAASVLLQLLADRIATEMMETRGVGAVSRDVVLASVLEWWGEIATLMRSREGWEHPRWIRFHHVLQYDARHANPLQPPRYATVLREIEERTAHLDRTR